MRFSFVVVVLVVFFSTVQVFAQCPDPKSQQPAKIVVALEVPSNANDSRSVFVQVADPSIKQLFFRSPGSPDFAVVRVPESGLLRLPQALQSNLLEDAEIFIQGFDSDGTCVAKATRSAKKNEDGLFVGRAVIAGVQRPEPGIDQLEFKMRSTGEPSYIVDLNPSFEYPKEQDLVYVVERMVDGRSLDPIVEKVKRDIDSENRPLNPQRIPVNLAKGINKITVSVRTGEKAANPFKQQLVKTVTITCESPCEPVLGRSANTRAIVGFEQAGGSGTTGKVSPFLNFFVNVPLFVSESPKRKPPRFSIWTDFRLSSSPSQRFLDLSQFTTNFLTPSNSFSENQVVQNFRINAGIDVRIAEQTAIFPFFEPARSSLSIIAGGGITAPLDANNGPIAEIFKIPRVDEALPTSEITPEFKKFYEGIRADLLKSDIELPALENSKVNIAFSKSERVRFYKRLFAGFRLKSHFAESIAKEKDLSAATFDVTLGIDEFISNRIGNGVLSFEGFSPFPIGGNDYLYIYGGGSLRLTRKANSFTPIFLERGNIEDLESATTIIVPGEKSPFGRAPRDTYFFGIGFDFLKLLRRETPRP